MGRTNLINFRSPIISERKHKNKNNMLCLRLAFVGALVLAVDAAWKPQGDVHAHESPDFLFRQGDKNKDDFLDAKELEEFYKHDEDNYHGSEIAKHFGGPAKATEALDTNKDGKISADEFLEYASPAHGQAVAWDDFDEFNEDKNDHLDLKEYKETHYAKERVIDADHEGFAAHFKQIDKNGDGKITRQEWLGSEAAQDPFSHMDYNGDKLVSFEEFTRNEKEHYHGLDHDSEDAKKHSREAFDALDKNKDGMLTRAEDRGEDHTDHEYEKVKFDEDKKDDEEEEAEEDATTHSDL